jgi:hypothetical protein
MTIDTTVCEKLSPSERAASACPSGTPLIPERNASATNGEVYTESAITAPRNDGTPSCSTGSTMMMRKNTSVSGVLRTSSV